MNYDLLFSKCAPHDINLHWLIYGDENLMQMKMSEPDLQDVSLEALDKRALSCINMIKSLPWSVTVRRKLMENYIMIVYEDIQEGAG